MSPELSLQRDISLPVSGEAEARLCRERLLTWDIRAGDVTVVIGGYYGSMCQDIIDRYPECRLYTYEPQTEMYKHLLRRFAGYPQVHAFNYALGDRDGGFPMICAGSDFCSFLFRPEQVPNYEGEMREFTAEMEARGITEIAHFHMNIEGYEAVLVPYLIRTGWMERVGQLVIATHGLPDNTPGAEYLPWVEEHMASTHRYYWAQRQFMAWSRPDREMVDLPGKWGLA